MIGVSIVSTPIIKRIRHSQDFPDCPELWPDGFLQKLYPVHSLSVLDPGRSNSVSVDAGGYDLLLVVPSGR